MGWRYGGKVGFSRRLGVSRGLLTLGLLGLGTLYPAMALALETVQYTPGSAFTINLTSGNPNQDFGVVHLQSDSPRGWVLRVRSLQQGMLKHEADLGGIAYSLTVNGIQVDSLAGGNEVTVTTTTGLTCAPPTGCTFLVQATLLPGDLQGRPSGSYSDTLVFTLVNQ